MRLGRHRVVVALTLGMASAGCGSSEGDGGPGAPPGGATVVDGGRDDAAATGPGGSSGGAAGCIAPPPGTHFVFVTSADQDGSLGVGPADDACAAEAREATLCGRYVAWLSTSGANAIDRLPLQGQWVDVRGNTVFATRTALVSAVTTTPLTLTAAGMAIPTTSPLWTGTKVDGTAATDTCGDWSSLDGSGLTGFVGASGPAWTEASAARCRDKARVACFGF